jgi:hypothetical protein
MRLKFGRPSASLVVASIALFAALAGGAYAVSHAPKNSVVAKSIKNGAVKSKKIKDAAVTEAKIADNAVTGAKIKDGSVAEADLTPFTSTDASLENGWIAVTGNPVPTFGEDAVGFVHLEGRLRNPGGVVTNSTTAFTLPAGMRPLHNELFAAAQIFGGNSTVCVVTVKPDGSVAPGVVPNETGCQPNGTISVSGITFRAAG